MAGLERRTTNGGKTIRWRVKWRDGGRRDGQQVSRTFDYQADAKRFRTLVEAAGERMPSPEQLVEHGFTALLPAGVVAPAPEPVQEKLTFRAYAEEWLGTLVKPHPETMRKYRERLEKHVYPRLGDRPIVEITRREMREWQQGLRDAGELGRTRPGELPAGPVSAKTIANIRGDSVVPIFTAACRPGEDGEPAVRTSNPMDGLPLPEGPRAERDILESPDEARLFLEAAYAVDPEAADLLLCKLATGLRWGEVSALPPRAVNVARSTVSIVQVLRKVNRRWVVEPKPKTKQDYREVPLPASVMRMVAERVAAASREQGRQFVFVAPRGNHWRYEDFYTDRLVKIRDLARERGLPRRMTMHGLRHSLLTLLATEGVDLAALRTMAGHASVTTTMNVYVHATRRHHEPVRQIVGDFLGVEKLAAAGR
ncbi:Site-specific recombinase XerD [Micromonospora rhizosphaerae]|uniref:Site-specific recombinase XerD n=1 Tax=Micromonospora rhizosphaerae TaxID=568872 RepID=A0A1C6SBX8_9ACTN|nr:site-specific integrase [Micromonospora rhizosphaerae]SCL26956.1 Site-specific recombinase XerD [Micromonospora rhizosphaerae]